MVPIEDCPECGGALQVPEEQLGDRVECPDCGKKFVAKALRRSSADEDSYTASPRGRSEGDKGSSGGALTERERSNASSKKLTAGLCGILLGWLGIHKFVLGFTTPGVIYLVVSLIGGTLTCGAGIGVMAALGLIEGILYLTKSDEEFHRLYIVEKKQWF